MLSILAIWVVLALQIVVLTQILWNQGSDFVGGALKNGANRAAEVIAVGSSAPVARATEIAVSPPPPVPVVASDTFYQVASNCQVRGLPALYEMMLGRKSDGTFVEFGAYDGSTVSNTCGLADLGWRGVYIEPVPQFAQLCRQRHQNNAKVTVVESAVGPENLASISLTVGGALSTMHAATQQIYEKTAWSRVEFVEKTQISVPQRLLSDILQEQKVAPGFDVLVVDIEGYEWEALRNFDLPAWRPAMVIIELEDANETFRQAGAEVRNNFRKLREYFAAAHYVIVYKDIINTIYVREDIMR